MAGPQRSDLIYALVSVTFRLINPNVISFDSLIGLLSRELVSNRVIALSTDTVFGLLGRASSCDALSAIAAMKGREASVAMPVLIGEASQLDLFVPAGTLGKPAVARVFEVFWPGPLTVVLPLKSGVLCDSFFPAGTVGVRFPDDLRLQTLALRVGPLVATSANKHGKPTSRTGRDVVEELAKDGSALGLGIVVDEDSRSDLASTVIEMTETGYRLIRVGAISAAAIAKAFGNGVQQE